MIPVSELLEKFKQMEREHWPYETPGYNDERGVDCSGAFVWAYGEFGKSIYHGSNRIARKYVRELLPLSEAMPGMAAFKAREPGEDYYALPQGYLPGGGQYNGDLNDYYHIGLIDEDPFFVLNAKNKASGFVRSSLSEGWDAVGYLTDVDYGDEDIPFSDIDDLDMETEPEIDDGIPVYDSLEEAKAAYPVQDAYTRYVRIVSPNEFPVKIREQPKKGAITKYSANAGTLYPYEGERDGYYEILYGGKSRYVLKEFGQLIKVRKG